LRITNVEGERNASNLIGNGLSCCFIEVIHGNYCAVCRKAAGSFGPEA
jgi:hypothetical protein